MRAILREWISRLGGLFGRSRSDQDLEQELQAHLELVEQDLRRQGMSPQDAAREARVRAGRSTQTMETLRDRRGIPSLSSFWLDAKLGLRMLRKHWGLTLAGGLALTAAITVGASVFNFLQVRTGTTLPLEEGDRVVVIQPWNPVTQAGQSTSMEDFHRWRDDLRSVVEVGAFRAIEQNLITEAGPAGPVSVAKMSAAGFRVPRVAPLLGRFLVEEDERAGANPVLVIGYQAWQSSFAADPMVVGQRVQLDGTFYTVAGVMPKDFAFPIDDEFWIPLPANERGSVRVFARLAPGVPLDRAQAEVATLGLLSPAAIAETGRQLQPRVVPYIVGMTGNPPPGLVRLIPLLFALLLVPPCTNIAVLIYARTVSRQGEFAARAALGASRGRIVGQIFIEVLLLTAAAAGAALVLAPRVATVLSYLVSGNRAFWIDFSLSYQTILFAAGLALIAAMIAGGIPALRATGRWKLSGLHALNRGSVPRLGRVWTTVVVAQVALSVAVVPAVAEFTWATLRPAILGPGFDAAEFLTVRLAMPAADAAAERFSSVRSEMIRQLKVEPGLIAVTMSETEPFEEPDVRVEVDAGVSRNVSLNRVDDAFFDTFDLPLLTGRGFEAGDLEPSRGAIIVNKTFTNQLLGDGNPLGRTVRITPRNNAKASVIAPAYEIVGVVEDLFAQSKRPTVYRLLPPIADTPPGNGAAHQVRLTLHAGPTMPPNLGTRLRQIAASLDPVLRVDDVQTLDEIYLFSSLGDYISGGALAGLALCVVLFSVAGVYTLMSFTVVQRRREIGLRSALGASPLRLAAGIFRRVLLPVAAGVALGGLAALLIDYYMSPVLFDPREGGRPLPWILPAAEAFVFLIAAIALFGPVRRVLRVDSVEALREG